MSPSTATWYPWYEIHADPTDANKLIVCGSKWDSRAGGPSGGFVYVSSDGGETWNTALEELEDKRSTEHSCAFGVNGRAYFVSQWGSVSEDERPTKIYTSENAGRSWTEAATTAMTDHSASVVDVQAGPNQNRLYTFFNDPALDANGKTPNGKGASRVSVRTFQSGERQVEGLIVNEKFGALHYQGSYPHTAFLLKDGTILSLFDAALNRTATAADVLLGAVRVTGDRKVVSDPVSIATTSSKVDSVPCYGDAQAYDPLHDRVYVAYHILEGGKCRFQLSSSTNDGSTWSKGQNLPVPEADFDNPAMAFNKDGTLGLIWRDRKRPDCWYFVDSVDEGKSFSSALPLSQQCSDTRASADRSSTFFVTYTGNPGHGKPIVLGVVDFRNELWRNLGLVAGADGVFHAVWVEAGSGQGKLRTAALTVRAVSGETRTMSIAPEQMDVHDVTERVALLLGGEQEYHDDLSSGIVTLPVILKNKTTSPIRGAIYLKAEGLTSEGGQFEVLNASNGISGPGAKWDLLDRVTNGLLEPGAVTKPLSLVFRASDGAPPLRGRMAFSLQLKVFVAEAVEQR